jgi:hydroxyacid-oxoacid transhydrogenase
MIALDYESAFTIDASSIKYGPGVTGEVGYEMKRLGARRVAVFTDQRLSTSKPVSLTLEKLRSEGLETSLFDRVRIEPTDVSFKDAIKFAVDGKCDGFVAVGGGSTIDTAKAANLYSTYPAEFLAYVNQPIGEGRPVPGPLRPLIAIPTTAGTGSETTGVAVFDLLDMHCKTGIAHRALRPAMGIIDPENTRTLPKMVAACTGFDILSHAIEALTALPYNQRPAPANPSLRPTYQGSNPISDIWATRAVQMVTENIASAAEEGDQEARGQMLLAACFAGIGFGNAGVHLPHGMSYPVAGMVRDFVPADYPTDHGIVPHGMSVILNAPAVFRFTGPSNPQRHLYAAGLMGVDVAGADPNEAGNLVANAIVKLMRRLQIPNGLSAVGYTERDVPKLVEGTLPQHRVTKLSPRPFNAADLQQLFVSSMTCWD